MKHECISIRYRPSAAAVIEDIVFLSIFSLWLLWDRRKRKGNYWCIDSTNLKKGSDHGWDPKCIVAKSVGARTCPELFWTNAQLVRFVSWALLSDSNHRATRKSREKTFTTITFLSKIQAELFRLHNSGSVWKLPKITVFENHKKVAFNIASEASYFYVLSGQKIRKNAKNGPFWRVFKNLKLAVKQCYQTCPFQ